MNVLGSSMERMFPLYFPDNKGSLQKAASEVISALFVRFRYAGFPYRKPPSSQSVLCCQRGTATAATRVTVQSKSRSRVPAGEGVHRSRIPLQHARGWSWALGYNPGWQQTELILSLTLWR